MGSDKNESIRAAIEDEIMNGITESNQHPMAIVLATIDKAAIKYVTNGLWLDFLNRVRPKVKQRLTAQAKLVFSLKEALK